MLVHSRPLRLKPPKKAWDTGQYGFNLAALELGPIAMATKLICALCPVELTDENRTKEHIIPNSIGGMEKVEWFICRSCNSDKGETWDAALAAQFNWFSVMVGIVRDRKESPPERVATISGEEFLLHPDGTMRPAKFKYEEVKDGETTRISFAARTPREARKKISEIAKRFPQIDQTEALANTKAQNNYLNEPLKVDIQFGGPLAGRSVVKTALAFAVKNGIDPHSCESVFEFLHDDSAPPFCYGLSYLVDIVNTRPANTVFHCVAVHGSKVDGKLLGYVEYFGLARWLILLSDNYDGPDLDEAYAMNPMTGDSIEIDLLWQLSAEVIDETIGGNGYSQKSYMEAIERTMDIVMRISNERGTNNAFKESFIAAGKKLELKPGDIIGPAQSQEFAKAIVEGLTPYLLHRLGIK
ncbi:HNH endonuclease [Phaeospirillum tilakii]|uniref:HNH endonuclease n=1 Tax=Phaeospirillum tilakii TaxID=741673 RepID=A0ABW5CDL2_9PROT